MSEIWRHIPGWPYLISNEGSVLNLRTMIVSKSSQRIDYPTILLTDGPGRSKQVGVHVLVAEAFIGPRPACYIVHHKDHDKRNYRLDNLEYVTPSQNTLYAVRFHRMHPPRRKSIGKGIRVRRKRCGTCHEKQTVHVNKEICSLCGTKDLRIIPNATDEKEK